MIKIDLTKTHKTYFKASKKPELVTFEKANYISVQGQGDPSGSAFANHIQALYKVGYRLKFESKDKGKDFVVPKLEGLWWFDLNQYPDCSMVEAPLRVPRNEWLYRLLIRLPEFVRQQDVESLVEKLTSEPENGHLEEVEFFQMSEGLCVQILHTGPFDQEPVTLQILQEYMHTNQLMHNGLHHEIYLSDFRKTAPENLKTILREPVRKIK